MPPFFSIVLPTYNRAHLITKAIDSVVKQSFNDWELIIIDDGSTDNTKEIVASYTDARIKYLYQDNAERSAARNNGINLSKGKYICFLDSDDYYLKDHLKDFYDFIINSSTPVSLLYSGINIENNGELTKRNEIKKTDSLSDIDFIIQATIHSQQTCIHKSILLKHQFNTSFSVGEDMELWLRIVQEFPLFFVDTFNIITVEHDNRSVNSDGIYLDLIKLLNKILNDKKHPGYYCSTSVKNKVLSNVYFRVSAFYLKNKKPFKSLFYLIKAIIIHPKDQQTKYRLNILRLIITNISKANQLVFSDNQI